jgi:ABC-type branched-subunit amino acid transport system ATPase component
VRFAFGKLNVLRGIDLDIMRGELLCIVGPNGAGKSTLIEVVSDGFRNITGLVTFNLGNAARHWRRAPDQIAAKGIVRKFQIPSLFKSLTVAEHILLASRNGRLPSFWRRTREVRVPASVIEIVQATGLA